MSIFRPGLVELGDQLGVHPARHVGHGSVARNVLVDAIVLQELLRQHETLAVLQLLNELLVTQPHGTNWRKLCFVVGCVLWAWYCRCLLS